MYARSRLGNARWWLRIAIATGVTGALLAVQSFPAQAAPVGPTTVLVGVTTQSYPSYFRISPNGKTVKASVIALGLTCASGATFAVPDEFTHVHIGPTGHLAAEISLPPTAVSGGGTLSGSDSMSAKLNRRRTEVTGVWQLQLFYTFPDGSTDQCDSGPVGFADSR